MSSSTSNINYAKPTAFASVITGKQIKVLPGDTAQGPYTTGRNIYLGCSVNWDEGDRFAVLVHECCHQIFPANYPAGNIRELANLIDDCRIERQFIAGRPHYEDVLASLAINVIANGIYEEPPTDHWTEESFDPALWALLFFRPHCGEEVRLAAADAINAYAARKGYDKPEYSAGKVTMWPDDFSSLVEEGQRITRLKTVSKETLEKWCLQYFVVFPEAKRAANQTLAVKVLNDQPAPKGDQKDQEGQGSVKADGKILAKATGQGGDGDEKGEDGEEEGQEGDSGESESQKDQDKGQGKKSSGSKGKGGQQGESREAKAPADLEGALEKLKAAVGKVGQLKKDEAKKQNSQEEGTANGSDESAVDCSDDLVDNRGIGKEKAEAVCEKVADSVDKSFTNRIKMSIRKLRTLVMDRNASHRKVGRLHLPTVIGAERRGVLPRKPFISSVEEMVDAPVSCVVATDFSGSTDNINGKLNQFAHNALYALQSAGCECAEVVWNSGATITKTLDQQVSPLRANRHHSSGGTDLVACSTGCIEALRRSRAQRKVAFIFTDGAVYEEEVPAAAKHLKDNGFEAVLLVSLGQKVPYSGIISTEVCGDIASLTGIFDRWVRKQSAKAAEGALS